MGNYRNFTLTTYFVAHATARVTREALYVKDAEAVFEVDARPGQYVLYQIIR